jgi:flagellar protein FlaF
MSMGFDTVVAAIMVSAIIIAVAYTFLAGSTTIAEYSVESYKEAVQIAVKKLKSDMTILSVSYNDSTQQILAFFKNSGEEKYPDFTGFDCIVYGNSESGRRIAIYLNSTSYNIISELINPGIFDPQEVAEVRSTLTQPLENGTYVLLLCTPNAVCDSYEFTIP